MDTKKIIFLLLIIAACTYNYTLPNAADKVLVFSDQLNDAVGSANFQFNAQNYIGTQKIDKERIDAYKSINPDFIVLQYHKAYGVDLGGNVTSANYPYWNNDCDTFYAWVDRNPEYGDLEDYYLHYDNIIDSSYRIEHYYNGNMEFYLANLSHEGWRKYVTTETYRRCTELGFDGTFFDVCYFPWHGYVPENWCERQPYNASSFTQFGNTWNNDFAVPYFEYIMNYYHSSNRDMLCIPNCDQMVTGWYTDEYLNFCDGAMVEGFFTYGGVLVGSDWELSASRILQFLTGYNKNKIMIAQPNPGKDNLELRKWCIANYFLLKNKYSYYNFPYSPYSNWWPEYNIDLGAFVSVPTDLSDLLVNQAQSLYMREFEKGIVLVNPGNNDQQYLLEDEFKEISFTGGGLVNNGDLPEMSINYGEILSGNITIPKESALILKDADYISNEKSNFESILKDNVKIDGYYLIDIKGQKIYIDINRITNSKTNIFNGSSLASGIYLLMVKTQKGPKFVKRIFVCK